MEAARLPHLLGLTLALLVGCAEAEPEVTVVLTAELDRGPALQALTVVPEHLVLTDADGVDHAVGHPRDIDVLTAATTPVTLGGTTVPAGTYEWVFLEAAEVRAEGAEIHNVIETTGLPPLELLDGDEARILVTLILLQDANRPSASLFVKGATVRRTRPE